MAETERNYFELTINVPARAEFPNVITPKTVTQSSKEPPKFSADFALNPEDPKQADAIQAIRLKIGEAAHDLFPTMNVGDAIRSGELQVPLHSGDTLADGRLKRSGKDDRAWSRGHQILTARSGEDWPPTLAYYDGARVVELADGAPRSSLASKFYTGVYVNAQVRFQAWSNNKGEKGVTCYLQSICSYGKGKKLTGGKPSAADVFKGHIGLASDEDPTGGAASSGDTW
jgi:hypothetical protein